MALFASSSASPARQRRQRWALTTLASALFALSLDTPLHAQPVPQAAAPAVELRDYSVAAGSLDQALMAFGQQADIAITVDGNLTRGRTSPGLTGRYRLADALQALLGSSGLRAHPSGPGEYTLLPVPTDGAATQLAPVRVTARAIEGTEGRNSYTTGAISVGAGVAQSLRDIPRSVSVLTRQQLDDQRMTSLDTAMAQLPGVTVVPQGGNAVENTFYARGYAIHNILVDGLSSSASELDNRGGATNLGLAKYDSVQLLRGPDGLFSGNGVPSASVNLVRKRALPTFQAEVTASAGSDRRYVASADINTPLVADGSIRARLVVEGDDGYRFFEGARRRKQMFYGVVDAELTPDTVVSVGASRDRARGGSDQPPQVPRYANGEPLPISPDFGNPDWVYRNYTVDQVFATLEHQFNDNWRLQASASRTRASGDSLQVFWGGAADPITHLSQGVTNDGVYWSNEVKAANLNLHGEVEALGRSHLVMLGADTSRKSAMSTVWSYLGTRPSVDWRTLNPGDFGELPITPNWSLPAAQDQHGVYGYTRLGLTDSTKLVLGGRYAHFKTRANGYYFLIAPRTDDPVTQRNNGIFTPYAALIQDLSAEWSTYLTYAESYEDQSQYYDSNYDPLQPTRGRSLELGLKGELMDGLLNTNLTLYHTRRRNYAVLVGTDPNFETNSPGQRCCYSGDGTFTSRGVEIDVSGALTAQWQVNAGYTYDDNRTDYGSQAGQRLASQTPRHSFKLWTRYQFADALKDWAVGGGVRIQSSAFRSGTVASWNPTGGPQGNGAWNGPNQPYAFTEPGRAIWSVFAQYRFHPQWSASLNVDNLFNKRYYAAVGNTGGNNIQGAPRSVLLTVRGQF